LDQRLNSTGKSNQHKTLEEREREYAEARKRIMGVNNSLEETNPNKQTQDQMNEDKIVKPKMLVKQFPKIT
jgi:hypothetical protein